MGLFARADFFVASSGLFYVFLLVCGAISIALYLLFIFNLVPGAKEERLGRRTGDQRAVDVQEDQGHGDGLQASAPGVERSICTESAKTGMAR